MQSTLRASPDTIPAADTLHAVGICCWIDIHLARFDTSLAVHTGTLVKMHAEERKFVEQSVERTQRAKVFAERSVHDQRRYDHDPQHQKFPLEDCAQLFSDGTVQENVPQSRSGS